MRSKLIAAACAVLLSQQVSLATVFINEVFVNPPGSLDDAREFIELAGVPGRSLDGFALAFLNGTEQKYYPLDSIPPFPVPTQEIDEVFSLDGLSLGANGLLVVAISNRGNYPEVLADSSFLGNWENVWNGGLDVPGRLQNDGSNTIVLVRNRPGRTEADPSNAGGLRWGKMILHDIELITSVEDPQDEVLKDQWGDGALDEATPNGFGGTNLDMVGSTTPLDSSDDLELVDEVSYEHERGWEYDIDERDVDVGSSSGMFPQRRVHALDDPQGFNPDALVRVDSRLTGPGWPPAPGSIGQMTNGNNWQDTATEQWIRGESTVVIGPMGPELYLSNSANNNVDAIQPYTTHVPLWLDDGVGTDYDFSGATTYRMSPGRTNPLSIPYIPGDVDRDGDCDGDDIDRVLSQLGRDDWIFSNAFDDAPESNEGDPAEQVRPWDVDQTGSNGIECSDLQWVLNFLGDTTGRVRGRAYDDTNPTVAGVVLKPSTGVECDVQVAVSVDSGRALDGLRVGDQLSLDVTVLVSAGAVATTGEENGVMQVIHDLTISTGGVARVIGVEALGAFSFGRPDLITELGSGGDLGAASVHAFTTSFVQGIGGVAQAYRVRLEAIGLGSADVSVSPAGEANFAASTPAGLKVGHTAANGDPASESYPAAVTLEVTEAIAAGDCNETGTVEIGDVRCFTDCLLGPATLTQPECGSSDLDKNGTVDLHDWTLLLPLFEKP